MLLKECNHVFATLIFANLLALCRAENTLMRPLDAYESHDVRRWSLWGSPNVSTTTPTTISKFPPILEYLVQRIQSAFSNYVHEDLSRPATEPSFIDMDPDPDPEVTSATVRPAEVVPLQPQGDLVVGQPSVITHIIIEYIDTKEGTKAVTQITNDHNSLAVPVEGEKITSKKGFKPNRMPPFLTYLLRRWTI